MSNPPNNPIGPSTTVIGLGNEYLSDDGLGVLAVRQVAERLPGHRIAFKELAIGGLELLDHLIGFDRCIIIDAVATGRIAPGTIVRFTEGPGAEPTPIASSHQIDLRQILTLAQLLGADVPGSVSVYGIEAEDITTFHSGLTPEVARSLPALVDAVCGDLSLRAVERSPDDGRWHIINNQVTH